MKPIYLDYAAATPVSDRVLKAMMPFFQEKFYNPSSVYTSARAVRADFDEAKAILAACIGAKPGEIIMTSGATESVNLAINGVRARFPDAVVVVSAAEHQAVLKTAQAGEHRLVPVDERGRVSIQSLTDAIDDRTVLVSIGLVNSEIGTIQPMSDFARAIHVIRTDRLRRGINLPLYLHTDASQAAGLLDISVGRLGVDLMTLSAAKIYGPKQSGLLFIKAGTKLVPSFFGGGQELGLRSGTEQTALTAGFAASLHYAHNHRQSYGKSMQTLRDRFEKRLIKSLPETTIQGDLKRRASHITYLGWEGIDAERLLFMLDEQGVCVSTGAACAANHGTLSPVLAAISLSDALAQGSIRCSFGSGLDETQVDQAADIIISAVRHLLDNKQRLQ